MNCKCCVSMIGNQTILLPSGNDRKNQNERNFTYDYSYWSHSGYKVEDNGYCAPDLDHPDGSKYADQKKLFSDLGTSILENAWNGYNASLFAYGQTGCGKSYSIIGKDANKGVVPLLCDALFKEVAERNATNKDTQIEVTFSMLEIYNEVIRDLLVLKKSDRAGLPLHEKPGRGFHIMEKDLKPTTIFTYKDFEKLMDRGNSNKVIGQTKMNAESSRSHTIIELCLKQTFKNAIGKEMQRASIINLIDLAGSERVSKAGTEGERLKEGIAINLSLTSLGNCISALAQQAGGKNVAIPYRDSVLTKLLMNALGGNSKTVMIAALSPADNNYEETLSTLRYADRAKQIKCNAVINEDPKDKLIRQLQDEINELKSRMKAGGIEGMPSNAGLSKAEYDKMKKQMEEELKRTLENNEKEIVEMKKTYEEKLAEAQRQSKVMMSSDVAEKSKVCPHFSNINADSMLTGSLKYLIELNAKKPKVIIGASDKSDIQLYGLGILERHATISLENDKFYMEPIESGRVVRNGKPEEKKFKMENLDRYVFGASLYFLYVNPSEFTINGETSIDVMNAQVNSVTFASFQQEIAKESGLITESDINERSPDELECLNELIDLIPHIEEANQMSIILDKKIKYSAIILNPLSVGNPDDKAKPVIAVKKFGTPLEWLWEKYKFIDRKSLMSEMYLDLKEDGKVDGTRFKNLDPFTDSLNDPVLIGISVVEPKCILHNIPFKDSAKIFDYNNKLSGTMNVELQPCNKDGVPYTNIKEIIVRNPETQLKQLFFLMKIDVIRCMASKYKNIYCEYMMFGDNESFKTDAGNETNNADLNHTRRMIYDTVDSELISHYTKSLFIKVYGSQKNINDQSGTMTTKKWFENDKSAKQNSLQMELTTTQNDLEKLKRRLKNLESLIDYAQNKRNKKKINIEYVRECLFSNKPDILNRLYEKINKSKDD